VAKWLVAYGNFWEPFRSDLGARGVHGSGNKPNKPETEPNQTEKNRTEHITEPNLLKPNRTELKIRFSVWIWV
jgi:hypothetical protein